jgi:putative heme-binding domain-containing protein
VKPTPPADRLKLEEVQHIARYGGSDDGKELVAHCERNRADDLTYQESLIRAVERGTQERGQSLSTQARGWGQALTERLLDSKSTQEMQLGLALVGQLRLTSHERRLVTLGTTPGNNAVRLAAWNALATLDAVKHAETLGKAVTDANLPIDIREQVVGILARANQPSTRAQLVAALPIAPARLQNNIAGALAATREGGETLLEAISKGKASARLLQERVVVVRLEVAASLPNVKERLTKLTAGLPPADAKVNELLTARRRSYLKAKPNPTMGVAIYEKHCANCHQIGGKGAKVGPQLDGIGLRGLERLLEDTLDPNRNVDQAFRTTSLTLTSGKSVQGLLLREEGEVVVLADAQGKDVRIAKKEIEQRNVSPLSPMPANFHDLISEAEFHHLLAYLLAQKPTKP